MASEILPKEREQQPLYKVSNVITKKILKLKFKKKLFRFTEDRL